MKVTLKTAMVSAAISGTRIGKTKLQKLKEKWEKQKPLKVSEK